ncbi:MAG TPA: hypothetical protein VGS07_04670 [Thermoanaerobaculia bacterium]|jgi:hypothetical protein|nr:hypothetical protein [Thermoanaerobaculia bacterium]
MKKKGKSEARVPEIVSLNEELFSLEAGSLQVEELDRRLELAIAGISNFACADFTCGTFASCGAFTCDTFKIKI